MRSFHRVSFDCDVFLEMMRLKDLSGTEPKNASCTSKLFSRCERGFRSSAIDQFLSKLLSNQLFVNTFSPPCLVYKGLVAYSLHMSFDGCRTYHSTLFFSKQSTFDIRNPIWCLFAFSGMTFARTFQVDHCLSKWTTKVLSLLASVIVP